MFESPLCKHFTGVYTFRNFFFKCLGIYIFLKMVVAMEMTTNAIFSIPFTITFTRKDLLNIRQSTPQTFSLVFTHPETFLEILVRGAAALCGAWTRRRRGKRAGALAKLREQGFRTPLPSLHLANVCSPPQ